MLRNEQRLFHACKIVRNRVQIHERKSTKKLHSCEASTRGFDSMFHISFWSVGYLDMYTLVKEMSYATKGPNFVGKMSLSIALRCI